MQEPRLTAAQDDMVHPACIRSESRLPWNTKQRSQEAKGLDKANDRGIRCARDEKHDDEPTSRRSAKHDGEPMLPMRFLVLLLLVYQPPSPAGGAFWLN